MTDQEPIDLERSAPTRPITTWQENHGNLLLTFFAMIFVAGAFILWYRQNRFVPVRFPDGRSIKVPGMADDDSENFENNILLSITGAASNQGIMRIAFYETPETFNQLELSFYRISQPIIDGACRVPIPYELIPEQFAVAVFHDENENGILDRNAIGIPVERYGFSSDARRMTGPPSYAEALTDRPPPRGSVEITVR